MALDPKDTDFHRFLVRDPLSGKILDVYMTRVTFGVASSTFLATSVLQQVAKDHCNEYPQAAQAVSSEFYVDDILTGAGTIEDAVMLRCELCELLEKGCMLLRKWRSNSQTVLETIPNSLKEPTDTTDLLHRSDNPKALGVHWSTEKDALMYLLPR